MKRTTILFALLIAITGAFAQKGKVTSALSYKEAGKLDKAVEAIEETINASNPKSEGSISWPRTWEVRGEIYQGVFQTKDENFKKLNNDPLTVAYDSYFKALELDVKNSFSKSVKIKFTLLIADLTNQAVAAFNEENFEKALRSFEQIMSIEQNPVYIYGKRIESGTSFSLTYKSAADFDFDEYINNLVIDTIQPETPLP